MPTANADDLCMPTRRCTRLPMRVGRSNLEGMGMIDGNVLGATVHAIHLVDRGAYIVVAYMVIAHIIMAHISMAHCRFGPV